MRKSIKERQEKEGTAGQDIRTTAQDKGTKKTISQRTATQNDKTHKRNSKKTPGNENGTSLTFVLCCRIIALSYFSFCRLVFASFLHLSSDFLRLADPFVLIPLSCPVFFFVEILSCCPLAPLCRFPILLLSFCPIVSCPVVLVSKKCPVVCLCTCCLVLASA